MSLQTCLSKTKQFIEKNKLTDKVPKSKIEEFSRRLEAMGANSLTPAEFSQKAQAMIDGEIKRQYAANQAEKLMVIAKRESALSSMMQNLENWKKNPAQNSGK